MQLQLTNKAEEIYNDLVDSEVDYDSEMNDDERLVVDASLYVSEAYHNNDFEDLDLWCLETSESEFGVAQPMLVRMKVDRMINNGFITIIE